MYNYYMLIGKLKAIIQKDKDSGEIVIAVNRPYGDVKDDFTVSACGFIFNLVDENFTIGQPIAIKGRLVPKDGIVMLEAERIVSFEKQEIIR